MQRVPIRLTTAKKVADFGLVRAHDLYGKTVRVSELTREKMLAGGSRRYPIVIDNGFMYKWVGGIWLKSRRATITERVKYPTVIEG